MDLYEEDKKELKDLEKEIKKLKEDKEVDQLLLSQLEDSLNKLKQKIKYEN
jgi:uncharacterized protein YjgD (DUF1641 family)|tara:strand:- start:2153 stop:2305 length:153 start_codon:yes stop_codon:yes gene_type:complete